MRISDLSSDVCSSDLLGTRAFPFRDPRYPELLFRYRARNWPETLDADEHMRWQNFRQARLTRHTPLTALTQYGRASSRERLGQYVEISEVAVALKNNTVQLST